MLKKQLKKKYIYVINIIKILQVCPIFKTGLSPFQNGTVPKLKKVCPKIEKIEGKGNEEKWVKKEELIILN